MTIFFLKLSFLVLVFLLFVQCSFFVDLLYFNFGFLFSFSEFMFLFVLLFVILSIFFFIDDYVFSEETYSRFFFFFIVFCFSIILFVFSSEPISMFVGWEGLGLSSFFLVYYYCSNYAFSSAFKTVILNRIGDVFFIFFLFFVFGWGFGVLLLFFVFFIGIRKSAIFPFSSWLPAAMAAPTPVSALVHSSTLVTAGLLFLIKVGVCGLFLTWVGCFTFFLGGLLACVDVDCKKVVAFSTLSQLGIIFFCFSFGLVYLASLHVYLHAFFKSALFIMVGYGIITSFHNQVSGHIRFGLDVMCRLLTFIRFLSMVGVMFFSGFFSKHLIFFFLTSFRGLFVFVFFCCCLFTLFYRVRFFLFFSSFGHVLVGGRFPFFIFFCVFFSGLVGYFLFFDTPLNFFFVELGT